MDYKEADKHVRRFREGSELRNQSTNVLTSIIRALAAVQRGISNVDPVRTQHALDAVTEELVGRIEAQYAPNRFKVTYDASVEKTVEVEAASEREAREKLVDTFTKNDTLIHIVKVEKCDD